MNCENCNHELDEQNDFIDFIQTEDGEYWDIYCCRKCNTQTLIED